METASPAWHNPVVERADGFSSVTLYLPATDHTFIIKPQSDARVLIGATKVRPGDVERVQEVNIYLLASPWPTVTLARAMMRLLIGAMIRRRRPTI